jgi:hypothetical protein
MVFLATTFVARMEDFKLHLRTVKHSVEEAQGIVKATLLKKIIFCLIKKNTVNRIYPF